jgi:ElaB/YqjD/DUF883 family membrane-anchored ribosome-binding protein
MQISEEKAQEVVMHERRIEHTRAAMSDTISELQHRLSPGSLAGNAGSAVKEATVGRTGRLVTDVSDRVKANPLPAILVGGGLAWLWMSGKKTSGTGSGYYYRRGLADSRGPAESATGQLSSSAGRVADQVTAKVGDAADQVSATVGDVAETARQQFDAASTQVGMQAQRVQTSFQRMLEENPLPVALAAAGLGALIAAVVPTTPAEERMIEPAREQLSQQAKKVGEKAGQVAERAQQAAREEVQRQ